MVLQRRYQLNTCKLQPLIMVNTDVDELVLMFLYVALYIQYYDVNDLVVFPAFKFHSRYMELSKDIKQKN